MATDMPADTEAAHERWQRMWSHREQLLKVARRRSMSPEDAEDAVHEAMLRAAERPDLDDERLGAWLTTVTMRLCVDRYRQVNREAEVGSRPTLVAPGPVPVEEAVCDRAEAKWLAVRSGELPARQAEALRLKSEDLDVSQVAVRMGLSYRTVESLLARARRTLRASLAGTLGLVLSLLGRGRLRGGGKAHMVAMTSTAATLAVAGFVLPYALDGGGGAAAPAPRPAVSGGAQVLRSDSTEQARTPRTHRPSMVPARAAARPSAGESVVPLSVPPLPEVSSPPLPELPTHSAVPSVPSLPAAPPLPSVSLPVPTPSVPSAKLP
ncbi:RNA polymerase sigma factor (sigma-70 family) [Streptomyces griseochromogenes]|uniref:RNA polymerase sigma factor (Sigma-70 family) n=1 Tax=Streptomyces griseochromogenes TaxID=68214 RepID=A0A1B1AV37_9ACTN|nr:sigma-70 family RNA polymerase sigma factor [Streptomyces griseochromogenes]ANP50407.1 RNA polymerase subunit sigma [Streptomyces griseochromogenes]MBP2047898.1 RNA polymerase sigma factor (sigma-70 family) [Streptomyces griseochromogenes]